MVHMEKEYKGARCHVVESKFSSTLGTVYCKLGKLGILV